MDKEIQLYTHAFFFFFFKLFLVASQIVLFHFISSHYIILITWAFIIQGPFKS